MDPEVEILTQWSPSSGRSLSDHFDLRSIGVIGLLVPGHSLGNYRQPT